MVRDYRYQGDPNQVFDEVQTALLEAGYTLEERFPESGTIITANRRVQKDVRKYEYRLVIEVTDYIHVTVSGGKYIYRRASESSIAGKEMVEFHAVDRFPYSIQQKIFRPLDRQFQQHGWQLIPGEGE